MTKPAFLLLSAAILMLLTVLAAGIFDRADASRTATGFVLAKILPLALIVWAVLTGLSGTVLFCLEYFGSS